jgi:(R,R)-butanediol dehydrogenase / meso-butanediol dehydrogenase / diacetyl reductase
MSDTIPETMIPETIPEMMPAAVYRKPGELEITEWPVPTLGPHDVLLEVDYCGVCGSDLHLIIEGWGQPDTVEGHEYTGTVAAVGTDVSRWQVGDPVVGGPSLRCGRCEPCLAGRPSLCLERGTPGMEAFTGAFARFKVNHEDTLLALPEGMTARVAALAEPLAVALHGITRSGIEPGQSALVLGAGPIGSLIIAALRAKGVDAVAVVEPSATRRELGLAVGATTGRHPDDLIVFDQGDPGRLVDDAVDVVFECSGKRAAMEAGLCQLKRGGSLVLVGAGIERPRFDPNRIMMNELVITGAFVYDVDGFERALELLARGDFPADSLIEPGAVGLHDLLAAMQGLAAGEIGGKVMVSPSSEDR